MERLKTYKQFKEDLESVNDIEATDDAPDATKEDVKFIDLGLPSGILWADKNVGANTPEEYGEYLTFKEARKIGDVPSMEQYEELLNNCKWTWKGKGYEVAGPNGNSIYLPAAGSRYNYDYDTEMAGVGFHGGYWTSTSGNNGFACYLSFGEDSAWTDSHGNLYIGQSVRLVK